MNMKSENKTNFDVSVGKDELNNDFVINLPKLSHLLIAGVTGSGKSNLLHRIIATLASRISPKNLKLILIDPKTIELNVYNHLPHLLTSVITDARKTVWALKWAGKEMDRRLGVLQSENVRDIASYREKLGKEGEALLPILIVIDGLAEMVALHPEEIEAGIVRLAQTGHLVGIHLILSTTRVANKAVVESVKAAMPSKIFFKVASASDSINLLGSAGAERLNSTGEVLFQSVHMKYPICARLSPIPEAEIAEKLKTIKGTYKEGVQSVAHSQFDVTVSDTDELYEQAKYLALRTQQASVSMLQRELSVGFSRAGNLIDMLERNGVIGPAKGSKPRKVLTKAKQK